MNEYDSIKCFLNIIFSIIIVCFSIFSIFELMFMIDFQKIFWGGVIHIFIVYMMLDFMYALNREKEFMFRYNKRRKITVIRIVELYKQIELSQNV